MTLHLMVLLGMFSALPPTDGSSATCRLKVLLANNAAINAESVHTSDGWTFIHLDGDGVLGVPESHVLSTDEDCDLLDDVGAEARDSSPTSTPSVEAAPAMAPVPSREEDAARGRRWVATEPAAPSRAPDDAARGVSALEELRNRNSWWLPDSDYAQEDHLLRPAEYARSIDRLRNRNDWWWPHSDYATQDALLNRVEDQSRLDALRFATNWWWPTSDFAEEDELIGGTGRWR